jgi:hypothetical protein
LIEVRLDAALCVEFKKARPFQEIHYENAARSENKAVYNGRLDNRGYYLRIADNKIGSSRDRKPRGT